jgi:hypothetical protein
VDVEEIHWLATTATDAVVAWLGTLPLADLAVLLRDAGYDVRQLPAGTAAVGDALVVAAKEPSDG